MGDFAEAYRTKMKRLVLFLFLVALFLFLGGGSAPFVKKPLTVVLDGETVFEGEIKIDAIRHNRAVKRGGYLRFYKDLRTRYGEKESLNYLSRGLGDFLSAACERKRIDPLSATMEWTKDLSSPFIYYAEREGRDIPLDEIGRAVAAALDEKGNATVFSSSVCPEVTVSDLKKRTREMGRFTTRFYSSGENRRHNLKLAAEAISGTVLGAGETFSFNGTVGERTEERGFRVANVVVNGDFVKGVGGGVCQVSTTLFNAALLAGLPIGKAAAHSCPVSYVPLSRDCTVSSAIDFTFINDTPHPVYLAAKVESGELTFALFGEKKEGAFALESEVTERVPFSSLAADGSPAPPEAELLSPGREGIKSRLFLLRTKNGVTTKTLVRETYYPPKNALYEKRAATARCSGRDAPSSYSLVKEVFVHFGQGGILSFLPRQTSVPQFVQL